MRTIFTGSMIVLAAALALTTGAAAQDQQGGAGRGQGRPATNRFDKLASDPGGPAPKQSIVGAWAGPQEPPVAKAPAMTPLGQKMFAMHKTEHDYSAAGTNDPWYVSCDPMGFPRSSINEIRAVMFAQMPDRVLEVYQYSRLWREIWTDGRALPANIGKANGPDARWYGYSIGHWDGDTTFVVDSTGSNNQSWLDKEGHPHSVNMMVHETYARTSKNLMTNKITITDPTIYTAPFEITTANYKWIPDQQFEEQICIPSEMLAYRSTIGDPAGAGDAKK
jgi:hypothetical protein